MKNPKYEKFRDRADEYRFNLKAENGEIVLRSSEGYTTSYACDQGIESVRQNSPIDGRYERKTSGGLHSFNLKAGNGQIIGVSETYTTTTGRENGIAAVKRVGPAAPIEDLT